MDPKRTTVGQLECIILECSIYGYIGQTTTWFLKSRHGRRERVRMGQHSSASLGHDLGDITEVRQLWTVQHPTELPPFQISLQVSTTARGWLANSTGSMND